MILVASNKVSGNGIISTSGFSLSACSTTFSRCCLIVTKELPWFQASYIHPRALSAERTVKLRQGEQKGSFLMRLFIQGGKCPPRGSLPRFSLPLCWLEVGHWPLPSQSLAEEKDHHNWFVTWGWGCLYLSTNLNEYWVGNQQCVLHYASVLSWLCVALGWTQQECCHYYIEPHIGPALERGGWSPAHVSSELRPQSVKGQTCMLLERQRSLRNTNHPSPSIKSPKAHQELMA